MKTDWKKVKLGEITSNIQTGPFGSQLHMSDYSDEGTPVVMPKDIINGKISESSIARVSENHVKRLNRYVVFTGNILYARRGDVGKCAYVSEKENGWLCGTGCLNVESNLDVVDSKFLFFQLQTPETVGWIQKNAVGATMLNLNTKILSRVPISLPPLETQQKISSILSAYDDLIENNRKQIKLLEEVAQRLYKEWFVDLRFPGYENVAIVDGVPEGWITKTIGEICVKLNSGGTPNRKKTDYWDSKDIKWYKTKELQDCWLFDSEEYISEKGLNNSSAKVFPKNTILMAIYASPTLGRLGILSNNAACNQAALCLIPNELVSYQWLYLKLYELRDYFNSVARGAGQQNISADVVKNKMIVIPKEGIMMKFTQIVSLYFDKIKSFQRQIHLSQQARDKLLPRLMSGEMEV